MGTEYYSFCIIDGENELKFEETFKKILAEAEKVKAAEAAAAQAAGAAAGGSVSEKK